MQKYDVDDDLAVLVERLAKEKPFENLSFNLALRRVLKPYVDQAAPEGNHGHSEPKFASKYEPKKAPSPSVEAWVATVPELKERKGLNSWKAVCVQLGIDTAGDSARRKLKNWVKANHTAWPEVPDVD